MRAIWRGAVSFGLVNVPVRVFGATQEHDVRFHQVHEKDGGRIRYRRVCQIDGEEVAYDQIAKGYEAPDGRSVVITDEDLAELPISNSKEIEVLEFVPAEQVDPILFDKSYYLEPEARTLKPYALLREALVATDRMAVVKVALRQRETLAVLRVRGKAILMQTLLWPDEVRRPDFDVLAEEVDVRPQETAMAASLVESLSADFEPEQYTDEWSAAVSAVVEAKLAGVPLPAPAAAPEADSEVVDLITALQMSIDKARKERGDSTGAESDSKGSTGTEHPRAESA